MSEQMRNVEPHARLSGNKIIYPISMNREDLSKLSKEQLINMLLGKQIVSANKAGPFKQTASTAVGPRGGGGWVLPYTTYTGMCRPTGS